MLPVRAAVTVLAFQLLALASSAAPVRESMVERARRWTRLDVDNALDLLANLREEEVREVVRIGPDDVVPLAALYCQELQVDASRLLGPVWASGHDEARRRVMLVAVAIPDPDLVARGVEALAASGGPLRSAILDAFAQVHPHGAEQALLDEIEQAEGPGVRAVLLAALSELATGDSTTALVELLGDEDANVRRLAVRALRQARDPEALPLLLRDLKSEKDASVLREIELAKGALGGTKERAELEACVGSARSRIDRAQCLEALSLSPDPSTARALAGVLTSPRSDLRREAAMALGSRQEAAARTALLSEFESEEDPIVFRFEAASLARLGEKRATGKLQQALSDPNLALWAAFALGELGDAKACEVLRAALADPESIERALELLGKLRDQKARAPIEKAYGEIKSARLKALALRTLLAFEEAPKGRS